MSDSTRTLEAGFEELERKLDALSEYCAEPKDRLRLMAVAKVPEPRFPFFHWQLAHGLSLEEVGSCCASSARWIHGQGMVRNLCPFLLEDWNTRACPRTTTEPVSVTLPSGPGL